MKKYKWLYNIIQQFDCNNIYIIKISSKFFWKN